MIIFCNLRAFLFILVFVIFIQDIDGVWSSSNFCVASKVCRVLLDLFSSFYQLLHLPNALFKLFLVLHFCSLRYFISYLKVIAWTPHLRHKAHFNTTKFDQITFIYFENNKILEFQELAFTKTNPLELIKVFIYIYIFIYLYTSRYNSSSSL